MYDQTIISHTLISVKTDKYIDEIRGGVTGRNECIKRILLQYALENFVQRFEYYRYFIIYDADFTPGSSILNINNNNLKIVISVCGIIYNIYWYMKHCIHVYIYIRVRKISRLSNLKVTYVPEINRKRALKLYVYSRINRFDGRPLTYGTLKQRTYTLNVLL